MARRLTEFERLYHDHLRSVYGFIAYRVQSVELAEDLTQTTFERALRNWGRFDPRKASERTWLLVIARNLVIDHHRERRPETVPELEDQSHPTMGGPEQDPGISPDLALALESLSDRDREVVALRYGADLTGPEIARLLGLSVANVQQILSRSLRRLRDLLSAGGVQAP